MPSSTTSSSLVGTNVQIQGFGFSTTTGDNQFAFDGTAATVVSAKGEGAETLRKQRLENRGPCGSGVIWQDGRGWKDVL
ncbi:MAG: hypothetical protein ACREI2_03665 [Nitrospiraceae bacterium]